MGHTKIGNKAVQKQWAVLATSQSLLSPAIRERNLSPQFCERWHRQSGQPACGPGWIACHERGLHFSYVSPPPASAFSIRVNLGFVCYKRENSKENFSRKSQDKDKEKKTSIEGSQLSIKSYAQHPSWKTKMLWRCLNQMEGTVLEFQRLDIIEGTY